MLSPLPRGMLALLGVAASLGVAMGMSAREQEVSFSGPFRVGGVDG